MDALLDTQTHKLSAIRPLLQRDKVAGHDIEQVWRKGDVAVFARSIPGRSLHEYEVVIVKVARERVSPSGSVIPIRQEYPATSKWGTLAWSVPKREQAIAWAEIVLANLGLPREERTAWPELFTRFWEGRS
jgi:hypothetical protein